MPPVTASSAHCIVVNCARLVRVLALCAGCAQLSPTALAAPDEERLGEARG